MSLRSKLLGLLAAVVASLVLGNFAGVASASAAVPEADGTADVSVTILDPEDRTDPRYTGPPRPGTLQLFPIFVTNNDPTETATGIAVRITLPRDLTVNGDNWSGNCTYDANIVICPVDDIAPGQVRDVVLFLDVAADAYGEATMTADVVTETEDPDLSNNTASWSYTFGASSDVSVTQTLNGENPGVVGPDGAAQIMAVAHNNGPDTAENVRLTLSWSEGLSYVYFDERCDVDTEARTVVCNFGQVTAGTGVHLVIDLHVEPGVTTPVTTTATAEGSYDPNLADNTSEMTFSAPQASEVPAVADLSVQTTADVATVKPRQQITWSVTVANAGAATAEDVVLVDTIPARTAVVSMPSECSQSERVLTCDLGELAAGQEVTLQIVVAVKSGGKVRSYTNVAEVSTSTAQDEPAPAASATVTKVSGHGKCRR